MWSYNPAPAFSSCFPCLQQMTHREDEGFADKFGGELHGALLADVADENLARLALRAAGDSHVRAVQVLRQPDDLQGAVGAASGLCAATIKSFR